MTPAFPCIEVESKDPRNRLVETEEPRQTERVVPEQDPAMRVRPLWFRFLLLPSLLLASALCLAADQAGTKVQRNAGIDLPIGRSDYVVRSWDTEEGLPQGSVNTFAQTPDGYLWMGTFNGLVRFDGVKFTVFDPANTPQLPSGRIVALYCDRAGRLFICSEFGQLTILEKGEFKTMGPDRGLPARVNPNVREDTDGRAHLSPDWEEREVFRFTGERFEKVVLSASFSRSFGYISDQEGYSWHWSGAHEITRFVPGKTNRVVVSLPGVDVFKAFPSQRGGICAWGDGAIYLIRDGRIEKRIEFPLKFASTPDVFEDSRGNLWLTVDGQGVYLLDLQGRLQHFLLSKTGVNESVRPIFEDMEGNIWMGSDGHGLHRFTSRVFRTFSAAQGLGRDVTMAVVADSRGHVWAANGMGVDEWRPEQPDKFQTTRLPISLAWSAHLSRSGTLWFGTYGHLLFALRHGGLEKVAGTPKEITSPDTIDAILETREGELLIGSHHRLFRLEDGSMVPVPIPLISGSADVRALAEDSQGNLYVGLNGGGLLRRAKGQWFYVAPLHRANLNRIYALFPDSEGALWIGTVGDGLALWKEERLFHFEPRRFLLPRTVCGIIEDDLGYLWIASNEGVFRADKKLLIGVAQGRADLPGVTRYGTADGMEIAECTGGTQPVVCKTPDGKLWFATVGGVAVVDPKSIRPNLRPPPVIIEEVAMDGETKALNRGGRVLSQVVVAPDEQSVELRYAGICFTAGEKVRYRYRLEGFDRRWVEAGSDRSARYVGLPPGHYTFRVIACNNDGVWNRTGATLAVIKQPYFWQTSWFMVLSIAGLAGLGGWTARYVSLRRLRRRLQLLEQQHAIERERTRIAQDIHDDLGARLTQISLLSELAKRESTQPEETRAHMARIAENSRELIQAMDEIVWAVDPSKDTLDNLANYLAPFAQEFVQMTPIRCRLDIPGELPSIPLSAEARHSLALAVKEALHNVVKHSNASEAWIRLAYSNSTLALTIEDNGCGFDPAHLSSPQQGNGLENMRKRIQDLGGQFELSARPGAGTKVVLRLDLAQSKN